MDEADVDFATTEQVSGISVQVPDWAKAGKTHDWRNHVPHYVQDLWVTFSHEQKAALAFWADDLAMAEEWD